MNWSINKLVYWRNMLKYVWRFKRRSNVLLLDAWRAFARNVRPRIQYFVNLSIFWFLCLHYLRRTLLLLHVHLPFVSCVIMKYLTVSKYVKSVVFSSRFVSTACYSIPTAPFPRSLVFSFFIFFFIFYFRYFNVKL